MGEQAQKVEQLHIQEGAEQERVDARVQEIMSQEKAQETPSNTALDELRELEAISKEARNNYLASAHNRRGGHLWSGSACYDRQLRAAEMHQLTRTSHALQKATG